MDATTTISIFSTSFDVLTDVLQGTIPMIVGLLMAIAGLVFSIKWVYGKLHGKKK